MLPHIFEMFMQVDRNVHRSQGGLGIGLTLVKQMVEMHGGSVEARSAGAGQGSEFIVRLPTVRSASPLAQSPARGGTAGKSTPRKILVVDDNEDGANTLGQMLQILGHEVRVAHDGLAAIEAADSFRPEVMSARHRHAQARRLRNLPPDSGRSLGKGHRPDRADRLGPGRRSPPHSRSGF